MKVDTNEVTLFLACRMTPEQIKEEGLIDVVHKRSLKNGARPGLTCKAITGGPALRQQDRAWVEPARAPERAEKMRMIGCLMKVKVKVKVMRNHFYSFDNVIRKQRKGGAIGNKLTERLGKILMKRHCRKYVNLLASLGLVLCG